MMYSFRILSVPVKVHITDTTIRVVAGDPVSSSRVVVRSYDINAFQLRIPPSAVAHNLGEAYGLGAAAVDEWLRRDEKGDW